MSTLRSTCSILLLLILSSIAARAQTETARMDKSCGATIIASASGGRVRFTAPSSVVQIRLEVYDPSGKKLFDNEVRGGNVLDWHLQDGQAEPLADDTYLCVVTVKSLSGRITERIGSMIVETSSASVRAFDASQMTAQQAQAIGPVEENATLIVLNDDDHQTTTVIAHNGEEGQIVRGRGALTFRIGDFFSGKDTEQMRLTPEGNLGVGITHPQARLDVDGLIRARQGIVFPDGSIQYSAATRTYGAKSTLPGGSLQTSKSKDSRGGQEHIEAVLQNYIPKFTDNGGTLGNTAAPIYETVGGNVGIGTTTPDPFKLNVNGALNVGGSNLYLGGSLRFTDNAAAGYTNFSALNGNLTNFDGVNYEQLNLFNPGGDKAIHLAQTAAGSQIASTGTGNTTLALQPRGGNVGIGTTSPAVPLDVAGTINTSKQYNINGNRVLSVSGAGMFANSSTFAGVGAGTFNAPNINGEGSGNSFFGAFAGFFNDRGENNSFFGSGAGNSNRNGFANTFLGDSAGGNNTSGQFNTIIGFETGLSNTIENWNTFIGTGANGAAGISNATAIGFSAMVTRSNSLVLGSIKGVNPDAPGIPTVNVGIGTTSPGSLLTLKADTSTTTALEINQGAIKVAGAGLGTNSPVFTHQATEDSIAAAACNGQCTAIDHPLTNGDPNAVLIITSNWNPGGVGGIYNNHPIGVFYASATSKWNIFNQDLAAMPVGAAFNVLVVKP